MDYFVDVLFFLDIVANFRTAFFDTNRVLVQDDRAIAWRYLQGYARDSRRVDRTALSVLFVLFSFTPHLLAPFHRWSGGSSWTSFPRFRSN